MKLSSYHKSLASSKKYIVIMGVTCGIKGKNKYFKMNNEIIIKRNSDLSLLGSMACSWKKEPSIKMVKQRKCLPKLLSNLYLQQYVRQNSEIYQNSSVKRRNKSSVLKLEKLWGKKLKQKTPSSKWLSLLYVLTFR